MIPTPLDAADEEPTDGTPLDILPPDFHAHATSAVGKLSETVLTNQRRAAAGHPPVNCQLTGEQAGALAAMVMGLTTLLNMKGGRKG